MDQVTSSDSPVDNESKRRQEFVELLAGTIQPIQACIHSLIPNRNVLEDVTQEVCLTLWRKYDEFESGTNFRRWACVVTYNVARNYWVKERRRIGAGLSEEALRSLMEVRSGTLELLELKRELLEICLQALPKVDRQVLLDAYGDKITARQQASAMKCTKGALFTRLSRVRNKLIQCVQRRMS
tara:strand:+ start:5306 stop:5854 length:549 start_codon:yes stop_codon:yes gene_type:complete